MVNRYTANKYKGGQRCRRGVMAGATAFIVCSAIELAGEAAHSFGAAPAPRQGTSRTRAERSPTRSERSNSKHSRGYNHALS